MSQRKRSGQGGQDRRRASEAEEKPSTLSQSGGGELKVRIKVPFGGSGEGRGDLRSTTNGGPTKRGDLTMSGNRPQQQQTPAQPQQQFQRPTAPASTSSKASSKQSRKFNPPPTKAEFTPYEGGLADSTSGYDTGLDLNLDAPPPKSTGGGGRDRKNNKRNIKRGDGDGDADDPLAYYSVSGAFWKSIADYVAPFTEKDLKFCTTEANGLPEDHELMKIPELGPHFKEQWYQEDQVELQTHSSRPTERQDYHGGTRQSARNANAKIRGLQGHPEADFDEEFVAPPTRAGGAPAVASALALRGDDKDKGNIKCGDITSRILSALVEDQLLPAGFLSNTYAIGGAGTADVSDDVVDRVGAGVGVGAVGVAGAVGQGTKEQKLAELDIVLKDELMSLGLLDEMTTESKSSQQQEDEICRELRKAQQELQQQVIANQKRRQNLMPLVQKAMVQQREEKASIERISRLEDEATKELKNKKRPNPTAHKTPTKKSKTSYEGVF